MESINEKNYISVLLFASFSVNAATLSIFDASYNDEGLHENYSYNLFGTEIFQATGGFIYPDYYPNGGSFNGSVTNAFSFKSDVDTLVLVGKVTKGLPKTNNFSIMVSQGLSVINLTESSVFNVIANQLYLVTVRGYVTNSSQQIGAFVTSEVPLPASFILFLPALMGFLALRRKNKNI